MTAPALHQIIEKAALKWPGKTALIEAGGGVSVTYAEFGALVRGLAARLAANGLKKGERAGILGRNSIESAAALFAVSAAGGVFVPFNYASSLKDVITQAKDSSISGLFVGMGMEARAELVARKARSVKFTVGEKDCCPRQRADRGRARGRADSPAAIIYTSGSTGSPLGVMLSHRNLISNSGSIAGYLGLKSSSRAYCVLPLHYIYGLSILLSHILAGGSVVLDNRFLYPNLVLDGMEEYGATGFFGVSSHYSILLYKSDLRKRRLPALKYFAQAGDAMPAAVTRRLLEAFPKKKLFIMYGQTEAGPRLTYLEPRLARSKPESIGRAIPGVTVRVEDGEIIARGDNIMLGYWHNRAATARAILDGWLHTGDVGYRDKDGDIFITGRCRDFLKVGGRKVSPSRIERVAMGMEGVVEAAAIGEADRILGNRVRLFASLAPGSGVTGKKILAFCRKRLAPYEVPSRVSVLRALPKDSQGKIDRGELARLR